MSLEYIWESSRHNEFSWILPAVLTLGVVVLVLLNFVTNPGWRKNLTNLAFVGFMLIAMEASSLAIEEKWRIRYEWVQEHKAHLTEREQHAAMADGANRLMGPVLFGGTYAVVLFSGVMFVSWIASKAIEEKKSQADENNGDKEGVV